MGIEFRCPVCHVVLHVSASNTASVRCHECAAVFPMPEGRVVPDADSPSTPASAEFPQPTPHREPEPELEPASRPPNRELFYIVATVAAMLVLFAIGLFVLLMLPDRARWQTHESARGGYRVEFPSDPIEEKGRR